MKALELADSQKGCWRNISITTHYAAGGDDLISLLLSLWPNVVSTQPLSWPDSVLTSSDAGALRFVSIRASSFAKAFASSGGRSFGHYIPDFSAASVASKSPQSEYPRRAERCHRC